MAVTPDGKRVRVYLHTDHEVNTANLRVIVDATPNGGAGYPRGVPPLKVLMSNQWLTFPEAKAAGRADWFDLPTWEAAEDIARQQVAAAFEGTVQKLMGQDALAELAAKLEAQFAERFGAVEKRMRELESEVLKLSTTKGAPAA